MSVPEKFCAMIPICGGGMDWNAPRLINVPVRAFHGDIDTIVQPIESRKMVEALQKAGGDATLTVYPNTAHNAWSATYSDQSLFTWLKAQKNHAADLDSDGFVGDDFG
jgi:predicted peptidase